MWWLTAGFLALIVLALLVPYNRLVYLRQLTRNAWADVDVYLKRRSELIPNLVEAVRAYASHERTVLEAVTEARARAMAASGPSHEREVAESEVARSMVQVLAIAEAYPELKGSGSFLELQKELTQTEKMIASARQYYNAAVRDYNTMTESFPSVIAASLGGFKQAEFFEVDQVVERSAPSVKVDPS